MNNKDDDTTSICEGWRSSMKSHIRSLGSESLQMDRLIFFLVESIANISAHRDVRRLLAAAQ